MFVYGVDSGLVETTSGTPNTETGAVALETIANPTGKRVGLLGFYVHGRGAGLTAITGLSFRVKKAATSGGGASFITPVPRDPGQVAFNTGRRNPNALSGATLSLSIGCGAAGASGWFAMGEQSIIASLEVDNAFLRPVSAFVASGLASMNYCAAMEMVEC